MIRDDENGLLVDPYSPDELAERIDEALTDRVRMQAIRRAARETALADYSLGVCLPAQHRLIESVLATGAKSRFGIPRLATG